MNLPNQLSLLRILLTPVFVFLLFLDTSFYRIASFAVFAVASFTDWWDGYTARKYGIVSMWGKFLDPLADKILVSSGFISFSVLGYVPGWVVLVIVIRDFVITGLRSYAIIKGKPVVTNFFAKAKTFGQITVLYYIYIFYLCTTGKAIEDIWWFFRWTQTHDLIFIMMYLITFLTVVSGIIYLIGNRNHLRQIAVDVCQVFVSSNR